MLPENICVLFEPFCQGCGECDPVIRDRRERFEDGYLGLNGWLRHNGFEPYREDGEA